MFVCLSVCLKHKHIDTLKSYNSLAKKKDLLIIR